MSAKFAANKSKLQHDFMSKFALSCAQSAKLAKNGHKRAQMSANECAHLRSIIVRYHERKRVQLGANTLN